LTEGGVDRAGIFHRLPRLDDARLAEIFGREVLAFLVRKGLLRPEWAARILSWRHTGFNVHGGRGGGRGGGRVPRLCLGIIFRRTQPRIYIAGECPRLCLGIIFRRTQPRIYIAGECPGPCPGDPFPPHLSVDIITGKW
jgi:hypothetical protein